MADELAMREAIRTMLADKSASELSALVAEESAAVARAQEAAKAPPSFKALTPQEWAALKAFLWDRGGDKDYMKAFFNARVRMEVDDQAGFIMALFLLFKACRLSLPHLEV